jgi:hypothetical protein
MGVHTVDRQHDGLASLVDWSRKRESESGFAAQLVETAQLSKTAQTARPWMVLRRAVGMSCMSRRVF